MIVLDLFSGMACGYEALKRAGVQVTEYYASEIDKHAIKIAMKNHSGIVQLGDINNLYSGEELTTCNDKSLDFSLILPIEIDKPELIIGGSPCQGFSFAGKQLAFDDPRSKLFFKFVEIINYYKPKYFLLENVRMKKEYQDAISNLLGVEPISINSALVSAQTRRRLYWTNIPNITQPEDKHISICDIVESPGKIVAKRGRYDCNGKVVQNYEPRMDNKSNCLTTVAKDNLVFDGSNYRNLTPIEAEKLQTLKEGYTEGVSPSQRLKMLGNGWTIDVIAHIFKNLIDKV